jgi:hypothetical protein
MANIVAMCTPNSPAFCDHGFSAIPPASSVAARPSDVGHPAEPTPGLSSAASGGGLQDVLSVLAAMDQSGMFDALKIDCRVTLVPALRQNSV